MTRDTRATWAARVARLERSGVSLATFAAREQVNRNTLAYWRWRLRTDATVTAPVPRRAASFVEVVVPSAAREPSGLEVVLPAGYRVRLGDTVCADALRTVLDVLEARA